MKRILFFACIAIALSACKKESNNPNPIGTNPIGSQSDPSFGSFTISGSSNPDLDGSYRVEAPEALGAYHYAIDAEVDNENYQQFGASGVSDDGQYWIVMLASAATDAGTGTFAFDPDEETVVASVTFYINDNGMIGTPIEAYVSEAGSLNISQWTEVGSTLATNGKMTFSGTFEAAASGTDVEISEGKIEIF